MPGGRTPLCKCREGAACDPVDNVRAFHLGAYAHKMAWREDARRIDNGTQVLIMGLVALTHPPSFTWKGYWQRARRKAV